MPNLKLKYATHAELVARYFRSCAFREGIVQESWDESTADLAVNVGLREPISASFDDDQEQPAVGERVTVEIDDSSDSSDGERAPSSLSLYLSRLLSA